MNRRALILTLGALASGPGPAHAEEILGAVTFRGHGVIPAGRIVITLEDPANPDRTRRRLAGALVPSDGGSRTLPFALTVPERPETGRIVARLERPDGWLIARGSATLSAGDVVAVTLTPVSY